MKHLLRLAVVGACLLAVAAAGYVAVAVWSDYLQNTRGAAVGPDLPVLAAEDVPPLGVNAALQSEEGAARHRALELLRDGGYAWVRQPFPWSEIEPAKGVFSWEQWDRLVQDYRDYGLRVVAVLDEPPAWARPETGRRNSPPDRFEDFGDFVAAFAEHYRGQVDYLQIWDEPNIFPNWGDRQIDPAAYAGLLAAAYPRAKEANPSAVVLMAGLAPNAEPGGANMSDLLFLEGLYRAGAGRFFDVAAAKPYGLWYKPDDRAISPERTNFPRVVLWREIMAAHGDGAKPLWAVEFGWNSLPEGWTGRPSLWGSVTPEEQARYTVAAIERARWEWPWMPVLMLQGYVTGNAPDDPRTGFSVVDGDGRPRPVYEALRTLAAAGFGAPVGFHASGSRYVGAEGQWQRVGTALVGGTASRLRLRFSGTRVDAVVGQGPRQGVAVVTIDGAPANRLVKVDGLAWLDPGRRDPGIGRVTLADGLAAGDHVLELTVVPRERLWPRSGTTGGEVGIEGFFVVREVDYRSQLWLTLGLVLAGAFAVRQAVVTARKLPWRDWRMRLVASGHRCGGPYARRIATRWSALPADQRDLFALAVLAAGMGGLYVAPLPLVPLPAALLLGGAWIRPSAAAFALIAAAPFGRAQIAVGRAHFTPAEVLAVAALAALLGRWWSDRIAGKRVPGAIGGRPAEQLMRWARTGFNAPILLFVAASVAATLFAPSQREAARELRTVILEPLVLYWLVVGQHRAGAGDREAMATDYPARLIDVLVLAGVAVALIGLWQYLFTADVITAEGVRRLRSVYGSPNNVGLYLGRIIPLAACVVLGDRQRRWYLAALALLLAALALSFSVGAWLSVAVALLFVATMQGFRVALATVGGLAVAFGGALTRLSVERVASHVSLDQGTTRLRLLLWQGAANMLRDHPLLGVGPDNFLRLYRDRYMLPEAWQEPNLSHPHNLLLDFWLRLGLAGVIAGLWLIGRFFVVGLDLYRRMRDPARRALVLGLLASMVDFVVHGMVDNSLFLLDLALVFWLSCGVLEVLRREAYNRPSAY